MGQFSHQHSSQRSDSINDSSQFQAGMRDICSESSRIFRESYTALHRTVDLLNDGMNANSLEIVDSNMSPNFGTCSYRCHGRITSPIMLQEELNPSEFSQNIGSVVDNRNAYNSEGKEAETTFSDVPSSIHHDLCSHFPPVCYIHGQHSLPIHMAGLQAHNFAALNHQHVPPAECVQDLTLSDHSRSTNNLSNDGHESIPSFQIDHYSQRSYSPHLTMDSHRDLRISYYYLPNPIVLEDKLNASEFSSSVCNDITDDRITYNSESEEEESPLNLNTSIPPTGRQTMQDEEHHHPADLGHYTPPPSYPPLHVRHDFHSHLLPVHHMHGQHSSPGYLAELRTHNLVAMNVQYALSSRPSGVPTTKDIGDQSFKSHSISHCHHHRSTGSSHTSTPTQRYIQCPPSPPGTHQPLQMRMPLSTPSIGYTNLRNYPAHPLVMPEAFPTNITNDNLTTNRLDVNVTCQESNPSRRDQSLQTCSDASTLNSDPVFRNLPGNHSQISATTSNRDYSAGSSIDVAHLLLQSNIKSTRHSKKTIIYLWVLVLRHK